MKAWKLKRDAAWPGIDLRAGHILDSDGWLDEYDVEPEQHPDWFEWVEVCGECEREVCGEDLFAGCERFDLCHGHAKSEPKRNRIKSIEGHADAVPDESYAALYGEENRLRAENERLTETNSRLESELDSCREANDTLQARVALYRTLERLRCLSSWRRALIRARRRPRPTDRHRNRHRDVRRECREWSRVMPNTEKRPKLTQPLRTFHASVPAGVIGLPSELPGYWRFDGPENRVLRTRMELEGIVEWVDVCEGELEVVAGYDEPKPEIEIESANRTGEDCPRLIDEIRAKLETLESLSRPNEFACPPHGALFAGHRDEYPYCLLCEIARLNDRLAQFGGRDA